MANGDVFRLTMEGAYTAESIAVQHVLWFRQTSALPLVSEANQLADDFGAHMIAGGAGQPLRRVQTPGFQWLSLRCQKMLDPFEEPVSGAFASVLAGQGIDTAIPGGTARIPSVCALVATTHSDRSGRSGMGRIYFGGFATQAGDDGAQFALTRDHGRWSEVCVSHVQTWLDNLLARYNGAAVLDGTLPMTAQIGVWSRKFGNQTPPFNPAGFSPMTSAEAGEIVRLQRRREFGVGQ
jgi:hypothetical protein